MKKILLQSLLITTLALGSTLLFAYEKIYLAPKDFVAQQFELDSPKSHFFWLKKDIKQALTEQFHFEPNKLRLRYWGKDYKTVWILEEIGKEEPITVGITIDNNRIARLKVLIYRESRGHEVKQEFFTKQYEGSGITHDNELEHSIDGITGATLSVRALNKLARVALYLHHQTPYVANNEKIAQTP